MTDPKRLLSGGGTGLERQLLRAVAEERPSADLKLRMQQNLGLGSSVAGTKAVASLLGQVALATLIAAGIADTSTVDSRGARTLSTPSASSVPAEPAPAAQGSGVPSERSELTRAPVAGALSPTNAGSATTPSAVPREVVGDASIGAATRVTRPARATAGPSAEQALRDEIRLLDRARSALQAGTPRAALRELGLYSARFPRGAFKQEASVLRVEALSQSGERARAAALARDFVTRHPDSPHVDRVESVTDAGTK